MISYYYWECEMLQLFRRQFSNIYPKNSMDGEAWWTTVHGVAKNWTQLSDFTFTSFRSVQFIRSVVSDSLRPHGLHHARLPCPSPTPGAYSNSCPSSQWCHLPSHPLLSPSPPAFSLSQHHILFQWVCSSHQVAKVLELQFQHQSFQWVFRVDFL